MGKNKREKVEMSAKEKKIVVGFLSITISLAMIGYAVYTIFNLHHESVPKSKSKVMQKVMVM